MDLILIGKFNETLLVRLREFDKLVVLSDSNFQVKFFVDAWVMHWFLRIMLILTNLFLLVRLFLIFCLSKFDDDDFGNIVVEGGKSETKGWSKLITLI